MIPDITGTRGHLLRWHSHGCTDHNWLGITRMEECQGTKGAHGSSLRQSIHVPTFYRKNSIFFPRNRDRPSSRQSCFKFLEGPRLNSLFRGYMYFALAFKDTYIPFHVDNCFQIILLLRRASELMKSSSSNRTCRKLVMDGGFETRSYFLLLCSMYPACHWTTS